MNSTTSLIQNILTMIKNGKSQKCYTNIKKEFKNPNELLNIIETKIITEISNQSSFETPQKNPNSSFYSMDNIIGESIAIMNIKNLICKISKSNLPVLILGESGTGKELFAKAIHSLSQRSQFPFLTENCAAIPEGLLESEFFGFQKGSFSGAIHDKKGIFELADHGTLFLDEIADMSLSIQAKLLRAIQEGEVRRVGGWEKIKFDIRIISATNKKLTQLIQTGCFREDLFFRINVLCIEIPPLRQRKIDIPLLANFFLDKYCVTNNIGPYSLSTEAEKFLQAYHWPGNIRELKNSIERAATLSEKPIICMENFIFESKLSHFSYENKFSVIGSKTGEQLLVEEALSISYGDKTKAAKRIGWSRPKLYRKIKKFGIPSEFGRNSIQSNTKSQLETP